MDTPKHTRGPWRRNFVAPKGARGTLIMQGPDINGAPYIAMVNGSPTSEETVANADLIAAAPDLLAALRILHDHASETYPHFESQRGVRDLATALAAIAAATGGA